MRDMVDEHVLSWNRPCALPRKAAHAMIRARTWYSAAVQPSPLQKPESTLARALLGLEIGLYRRPTAVSIRIPVVGALACSPVCFL